MTKKETMLAAYACRQVQRNILKNIQNGIPKQYLLGQIANKRPFSNDSLFENAETLPSPQEEDSLASTMPMPVFGSMTFSTGQESAEALERKQDMKDVMAIYENDDSFMANSQSGNVSLDDIFLPTAIVKQLEQKKLPVKYLNIFDDAIQAGNYMDAYKIFLVIRHDAIVPRPYPVLQFFKLLRESENHKKCWELYEYLTSFLDDKKKAALLTPADKEKINNALQHVFSQVMNLCGLYQEAEKAMKIYRYYLQHQIPMNEYSYRALLYATCSRADFETESLSILKQMEAEGISADIDVYDNLLKLCMKKGDLKLAHFIWNKLSTEPVDSPLAPSSRTFVHMLFLLASIETPQSVNSRNKPLYNISPTEIIDEAARIFRFAIDRNVTITQYMLNAFLAVHCQQRDLEKSLMIFHQFYEKYNIKRGKSVYTTMFRLFDNFGQYDKMREFLELAKADGVTQFDFMAWRSIIRIAAAQMEIDEAMEYCRRMRAEGHTATVDQLRLLLLKITEAERWDAREEFLKLCEPLYRASKLGKWPIWNERTNKVNKVLDDVYGRPAGKGFLRGVHHNVKSRVPGAEFPYIKDAEQEKFQSLESESTLHQKWQQKEKLKKTPPPKVKRIPLTRAPSHIPPAFPADNNTNDPSISQH